MPASVPYSVQRVTVVSSDPSTDQFAKELHYHLQNSVGRPRGSPGQPVDLMVQVLPSGLFDQSVRTILSKIKHLGAATVYANVRIMDHRNGMPIKDRQITASSTSDMVRVSNAKIAEDMIAQIRAMLGLGLTAPHPIANRTAARTGFSYSQNGFVPSSAYDNGMYSNNVVEDGGFQLSDSDEVLLQRIEQIDSAMTADAQEMRSFVNREMQNQSATGSSTVETTPEVTSVSEPLIDIVDSQNDKQPLIDDMTVSASRAPDFVTEPTVNPLDSPLSLDTSPNDLCIVTAENDCLGVQ